MIVCAGSWCVPEDRTEEARRFCTYLLERTLASEPGVLSYSYGFDMIEPNRVRTVLVLKDIDALYVHRKADYVAKDWKAFVEEVGVYGIDIDEFEVQQSTKADWRKTEDR